MDSIKTMHSDEALKLVTTFIQNNYIAEQMGVKATVLSNDKSHVVVNGKPFYLSPERIEKLRQIFRETSSFILSNLIVDNGDVASQLELLRPIVSISKMATDYLGHPKTWISNRLTNKGYMSKGKEYSYYNQFSPDDIRNINLALRSMATTLASIELVDYDIPIEAQVKRYSVKSKKQKEEEALLVNNDMLTEQYKPLTDDDLVADWEHQLLEDELACGLL